MGQLLYAAAALALAAGPAEPAPPSPSLVEAVRRLEFVEMLSAVVGNEPIGRGSGWFHPSRHRYDWKWLAGRMDADRDGAVAPDEFTGPRELFDRLDRDGDGRLTAADFDWSEASPYWRQQAAARQLLRRADGDGDGRLSMEEWQALFKQAARGKDRLTADDLRVLLFPAEPQGPPSTMPSKLTLLLAMLNGELGSPAEGPAVGDPAPDFTLPTPDGKEVSLRDCRGDRPLVLVFGSFT